ncbi:MAG: tetratricopeptide repeat protein [Selenomonadaceae bacterium]|nr:tetratricopeptide repeat protein [Selenomonadaceae bacterium]
MKKFFAVAVAFVIILTGSTSLANERLIEASGEYIMDSRLDETTASATARAREEAKRAAVEKAGVYLESYSKTIDLVLDTDEVRTVAARLLKIQEESTDIKIVENSLLKFTVTIKALVDEINENDLKAMMQDKQALEELTRKNKELQEKYDELNRQMEQYRNKFDSASEAQKIEIKKDVARNTEKFSAVNEFAKGNEFSFLKNYSQALASYDAAINLYPQLAEAYNNRGIVKYELKQFPAAIEDYTRAIQLKSNYADALNNRGTAYAAVKQFQDAERDLLAALKLNNKSAAAHNNLGNVYLSQKNFNEAIKEYTQALQLNPNFLEAYYNRAIAHYAQGNLLQALSDAQQAMNLNLNDVAAKSLYEKINRQSA